MKMNGSVTFNYCFNLFYVKGLFVFCKIFTTHFRFFCHSGSWIPVLALVFPFGNTFYAVLSTIECNNTLVFEKATLRIKKSVFPVMYHERRLVLEWGGFLLVRVLQGLINLLLRSMQHQLFPCNFLPERCKCFPNKPDWHLPIPPEFNGFVISFVKKKS